MGCTKCSKVQPVQPTQSQPKSRNTPNKLFIETKNPKRNTHERADSVVTEQKEIHIPLREPMSAHTRMVNRYKYTTLYKVRKCKTSTLSTENSEKLTPKMRTDLKNEESKFKGDEGQLINNFKLCFDEVTGRAIGFDAK